MQKMVRAQIGPVKKKNSHVEYVSNRSGIDYFLAAYSK